MIPQFWMFLCPRITFLALLRPQIELLDVKNEQILQPSAPSPLPSRPSVYILDFWRLGNECWPEKPAFAFFPIRGSRRARQQLPRLPTARAQTAQTWEPVESLANCQTACMSVRGQGGGLGGENSGFPYPGIMPTFGRLNSPWA